MRNDHKHAILNWWNLVFFLLGLALATGLEFAFVSRKQNPPTQTLPTASKVQFPWGELEYTPFKLAQPDESEMPSSPELAKALSQTTTLLVMLRVTPQSDLEALVRYWGRGTSGRAMRPFLESLIRVPEGEAVNVSYFLPALARMRLYTFPDPRKPHWSVQEDALWTGLNFFNYLPDDRFTNAQQAEATIGKDYTEVKTNFLFGDLVVLRSSDRQIRHMCVHIADDVVFTKLAIGPNGPWILTHLPEVLQRFSANQPLQVFIYRKKEV